MCTLSPVRVYIHKNTLDKENKRDREYDLGIKYCPGLEPTLPVYTYVEYKPSTSTGKFTIFTTSTTTTILEGRTEGEAVGGEEDDQSGRRGDGDEDGRNSNFQKTEVAILISDWERRAGGGEERDCLQLPDMDGRGRVRRVSQEFTDLRQKFVGQSKEGGGSKMTARPKSTFATQLSNYNISSTTQGRGAVRKIYFSRKNNSSVVVQGGTLLAEQTAIRKRKFGTERWDSESDPKRYCKLERL